MSGVTLDPGGDLYVTRTHPNGLLQLDGDTGEFVGSLRVQADANGDGMLDEGVDELLPPGVDGGGSWSTTFSTAGFDLGSHTFFAVATDNDGLTSNVATISGDVVTAPTTVTYANNTSQVIPDLGTIVSLIEVTDSYTIADMTVIVDVTHQRPNDLSIVLTSPAMTSVNLSPSGGSGSAFASEDVIGTWTLTVTDGKKKKTGTLNSWSMVVEAAAPLAASQQFAMAAPLEEPNRFERHGAAAPIAA